MGQEIVNTLGFDVQQALTALDALDKKMAQVGETMKQLGTTIQGVNSAGSALDKFGTSAKTNLDGAGRATERLTVSWGMMARIVTTQAIVRSLSAMRREFEETARSAVDFQRKAAEIQTIAPEGTSMDSIKANIRALSDARNVPLDRTAAAYYQTLSNGITDTGEALQFLNEAAKFSKATNSDLFHSVDLLSGAMKSYNMTTQDTGRISSIMFEAIRAGRITADELGANLGRIGPRAAQLGVPLETTAAALAAITVKGVKTSEAITFLNGVFTGLSKPTANMTDALDKMGFASAETAIATKTLPGLLQALADSTDGSAAALAKLFPNIRGVSGELALSGKGLKDFSDNMRSMEAAGSKLTDSKFLQATATDAERVTKELNKLKNAMTVELGQAVLKTTANLSQFIGGADELIAIAHTGGPAITGLSTSVLALAASLKIASLAGGTLSKSLGALMLVPLAAGLGRSIGEYFDSKTTEGLEANLKTIEEATKLASDKYKSESESKLSAAKASDNKTLASALETIRELNTAYLQDVANATTASKRIVQERQQAYAEITRLAHKAEQAARESVDRSYSLTAQKSQVQFDRKMSGLDDATKARWELAEGEKLTRQAADEMTKAARTGDTSSLHRAAESFQRARQLMEQAKTATPEQANRAIERSLDAQLAAEKAVVDVERQRNQQLLQQRQSLVTVEQLQKKFVEDTKKQGYQNFLQSFGDVSKLENVLGKKLSTPDEVSRGLIAANTEAEQLRKRIFDAMNPASAQGLKNEVAEILKQFDQKANVRNTFGGDLASKLRTELQTVRDEIQRQLQNGVKPETIRPMFDQLKKLLDLSNTNIVGKLGFDSSLDVLVRALPLLQQLSQQKGADPADIQRLETLKSALQGVSPVVSQIGPAIQAGVDPSAQIASNFAMAADYAMQAAMALSMANAPDITAAMGGPVYRAAGGNIGTDTVPAMLSPGEFVVNAGSANRFASQLIAMNAGVTPVFRSEGGNVSTNVGDVSIVVNESKRPGQTGREIHSALQRFARRGA